jgi:tetratricopeptide (TPR) repeat protein
MAPAVSATEARAAASVAQLRRSLSVRPRDAVSAVAVVLLTACLLVGLLVAGLFVAPSIGLAAYDAGAPPRRAPIVPPAVPLGAREDWAVWSYVDKINQAWGKDWPLVIEWFEDLDARYPGNPMVYDKLYAAYIEDGRTLQAKGDLEGARRRYEQAAEYDPNRGIAQEFLAKLDALQSGRR